MGIAKHSLVAESSLWGSGAEVDCGARGVRCSLVRGCVRYHADLRRLALFSVRARIKVVPRSPFRPWRRGLLRVFEESQEIGCGDGDETTIWRQTRQRRETTCEYNQQR